MKKFLVRAAIVLSVLLFIALMGYISVKAPGPPCVGPCLVNTPR